MRLIGNKENLLDNIHQVVLSTGINSGVFCDFFSGTANVGRFFKKKGFQIISSDLLYFSYVLQEAYIRNHLEPSFKKLLSKIKPDKVALLMTPLELVCSYLNNLNGKKGFIYKHYTIEGTADSKSPRRYFTGENGMKIDAIRQQIEEWKSHKLTKESEYYILLACLIESVPFYANISGVYAAFLKTYDPRALKKLAIRPIQIHQGVGENKVFNKNSMDLVSNLEADILYLDPPYNERQYAPNYHLLETIAKYDNPEIRGITGMRNYDNQKSEFCNEKSALQALDRIARESKYKYLLLSYNSEGIMPQNAIESTLGKYGDVQLIEIDYRRFRSNSNGDAPNKKLIREQIYLLRHR